MKQLLLLSLVALCLASCSQDIEDNSPAFQAVKDSILYRGVDNTAAFNDNGTLLIRGARDGETVNVLLTDLNQGSIELGGTSNPNVAAYTDELGNTFSTANANASGFVDLDVNANNTVSGTFKFTALTANSTDTIVFSRGFMYEIPIISAVENTVVTTTEPDSFTARINTVIYNPTVISSAVSVGILVVTGQTSDTSMSLIFPENVTPDTYDLTTGGTYSATYTTMSGVSTSQGGSLTIVSNDTENRIIKGDFVFDTIDGFDITDGQFTINY